MLRNIVPRSGLTSQPLGICWPLGLDLGLGFRIQGAKPDELLNQRISLSVTPEL